MSDSIDFTPKITFLSAPVVGKRLNMVVDLFPRDTVNVDMTIDVTLVGMGVEFNAHGQPSRKQIQIHRTGLVEPALFSGIVMPSEEVFITAHFACEGRHSGYAEERCPITAAQ